MANGTEVLGIDADEDVVQSHNGRLTHVVKADATKEDVLQQLAVNEFERVVVAIGSHLEESILTTSLLLRFGIPHIWAKADSEAHGTILDQLGVPHVVYAEHEMGRRVAHLVRGRMQDYVEIDDDFALIKTNPPRGIVGISLGKTNMRREYGVTIIAVKPYALTWTYATAETILTDDDVILIAGPAERAEAFSQLR